MRPVCVPLPHASLAQSEAADCALSLCAESNLEEMASSWLMILEQPELGLTTTQNLYRSLHRRSRERASPGPATSVGWTKREAGVVGTDEHRNAHAARDDEDSAEPRVLAALS